MLVTFSCSTYADITLFGDVAVQLLRLMGHSGTVPGAILAEDVETARDRLVTAINKQQQMEEAENSDEETEDEAAVSLSKRALPLVELLDAASKAKCFVMWDKNN